MRSIEAPTCFTNASRSGRVRYRDLAGSIGVTGTLYNHMPVGIASKVRRTDEGLAV